MEFSDEFYEIRRQMRQWDKRNTANFAGGRKEGLVEGYKKGFEEGIEEAKREIALATLKRGININIVAECCRLSIQELAALKLG